MFNVGVAVQNFKKRLYESNILLLFHVTSCLLLHVTSCLLFCLLDWVPASLVVDRRRVLLLTLLAGSGKKVLLRLTGVRKCSDAG